jgi:hypothetical protein
LSQKVHARGMPDDASDRMATSNQTAPKLSVCHLYAPKTYNRRSRQRFAAARTTELVRHLAHEPSFPQRIIISRIIAIEFELRKYDDAIADGVELSGHALRARLAAENRLRLDLVALGMGPRPPRAMTLADLKRGILAERGEAA